MSSSVGVQEIPDRKGVEVRRRVALEDLVGPGPVRADVVDGELDVREIPHHP